MASIVRRERKDGTPTWRVVWRQGGTAQSETFGSEAEAREFRGLVDAAKQRWPVGWVKGIGFEDRRPDEGVSVREWCERAVAARTGIEERTRDDYRRQLAAHVYPVLGDLRVADITRERAGLWLNGVDRAPKTVRNIHGTLSSLFADAVRDRIIDRNPFEGLALDRTDTPDAVEPVFLSSSEYLQLVDAMPAEWRPLILTLGGTGLRWSEATALQVNDVDLVAGTLSVRRAWKRQPDGSQKISTTKTKSSVRVVKYGPRTADALLTACVGKRGTDLVFTAPEGGEVRHSAFYNRVWARAVDAVVCCPDHHRQQRERVDNPTAYWHPDPCGCPGYIDARPRIHDLRHGYASWALAGGVPIHEVSKAMGHRDIRTTVNVYGHLEKAAGDRIAAAVEEQWAQAESARASTTIPRAASGIVSGQ